MKAQDVIARALRIVGVTASGEAASGSDVTDALGAFNALLAEWGEADIGIPDASVASGNATMQASNADLDAMAYQLAFRLGPEYGFEPSPSQVMAGEQAFARLRLRYFTQGEQDFSELPSQRGGYDIDTE